MFALTAAEWSTIGTFLAVAVALGISVVPRIWSYLRRPILDAGCGESEPHVRVNDVTASFQPAIRIAITNTGKTMARQVAVKIERWSYRQMTANGPIGEGSSQDVDPVHLRWITQPYAPDRAGQPPHIDLAPSSTDYVEVLRYAKGIPPELAIDDPRLPGKDFWHKSPYVGGSEHWVQVSITSANTEAIRVTLYFVAGSGMGVFVNVRFEQDIPSFPSVGITTLSKRASSSDYTQPPPR